jgi:hypothetical protein
MELWPFICMWIWFQLNDQSIRVLISIIDMISQGKDVTKPARLRNWKCIVASDMPKQSNGCVFWIWNLIRSWFNLQHNYIIWWIRVSSIPPGLGDHFFIILHWLPSSDFLIHRHFVLSIIYSTDCGIFALMAIERLMTNQPVDFGNKKSDISGYRVRFCEEVWKQMVQE